MDAYSPLKRAVCGRNHSPCKFIYVVVKVPGISNGIGVLSRFI